jgi:zinc transport system permease protein
MDIFSYSFMQHALIASVLASIACGIVGVYVVVKRIVFISGGISHASFGGIGMGYYLGINPVVSATFFSLFSAILMGIIGRRSHLPEDSVIGIMWATGMSIGILFIGLSPGYAPDLFSYLFGSILTVPTPDLWLMAGLDGIIVVTVVYFFKEFQILMFDEEFARVQGLPVERLYIILLALIALTVVLLIRVVGIILVIALITIPAITARQYTTTIKSMMLLAILFGITFTITGLWLSYLWDLPSGATIILVSGTVFIGSLAYQRLRNKGLTIGDVV